VGDGGSHNPFFTSFPILNNIYQEMIHHCKMDLPYEACGLLSGKNGITENIWKMKNTKRSKIAFSMDIEEIRSIFELIYNRNESLLGIYHSHPTDQASPSADDIALNNYPEVGHIIISFASSTPIVKCYCIQENIVNELPIEQL
jgi:[CysO sulfur-carrier protein]-S-L-cysteine hydrolase